MSTTSTTTDTIQRRGRLVVVGTLLALAASGAAHAAVPDAGGVISSCYHSSTGALRVIDAEAGQSCRPYETPLTFAQRGPRGVPGPVGPQGEPGEPGEPGPAGARGPSDGWFTERFSVSELPHGDEVELMALELPAGRFVATGETTVIGPDVLLSCRLASDAASHPGFEYVAENGMISLTGAFELAEPGTLRFLCFANIGNPKVQMGRLTAVQVAELH